jgi:hypothetical protein
MTSPSSRLSEAQLAEIASALDLIRRKPKDVYEHRMWIGKAMEAIRMFHSETGTVEPEHLQDAPRVAREKFKVPNPFPHDPKKPEQSEISVVFSSFAACIERETNTLRSLTPSHAASIIGDCQGCGQPCVIACPRCVRSTPYPFVAYQEAAKIAMDALLTIGNLHDREAAGKWPTFNVQAFADDAVKRARATLLSSATKRGNDEA